MKVPLYRAPFFVTRVDSTMRINHNFAYAHAPEPENKNLAIRNKMAILYCRTKNRT